MIWFIVARYDTIIGSYYNNSIGLVSSGWDQDLISEHLVPALALVTYLAQWAANRWRPLDLANNLSSNT